MILNSSNIFRELTMAEPVPLGALPRESGIYALHDHTGAIRYIGITTRDKYGLYGRINNRHVSGSEDRSHKFSHAYNTGRMWRSKGANSRDAKAAKFLRTAFARRYCRATFVTVLPTLSEKLQDLELSVQALAPMGMLDWGSARSFIPLTEPRELVDTLIQELGYSPDLCAAVDRQAALVPV